MLTSNQYIEATNFQNREQVKELTLPATLQKIISS